MSIKSELRSELVKAMKSGDRGRRDAIRSVQAEVQTRRTAPGFSGTGEDDDFYRQVIAGYVKKMRKAAFEYADLGGRGKEMSEKLSFEAEYLSRWLPAHLDEEQSRKLVAETVALLGVKGQPRAQGRVMGHIMRAHRQEVDGGLISRLVAEQLAAG
ncbi:MAG: GatB/YqeY domain-containing protein [bacterium]|nr:GatB/YqeY domain-containing protein [bacterium]MDE0502230.1 GatB/YqeY domain-containing protein [bacterium]